MEGDWISGGPIISPWNDLTLLTPPPGLILDLPCLRLL